ncbi:MAG TPA: hypothetical protein GXZ74_07600 [Tissierellia bacterium]|nr:hypothetical protein [Tissierellia bacterium]
MLKLIYEGRELYQLLDQIETNFVVMDWDNHLPFQDEEFTFVLDDPAQESRLRELADGTRVYLSPAMRQQLDRSNHPGLLFREELREDTVYPKRIHLAGDLETSLDFTGFLLGQVPFCVGFSAEGYRLEQLERWRPGLKEAFDHQLQPAANQNLILDLMSLEEATHQVVFWDGRDESLHQLITDDIKLPRLIANIGRRVKQSDYSRLSYIYPIPKIGLLRLRAYRKLWQDLIDRD